MTIIRFGSDIKLHHLQPVPITGAKGEELCLSYKISIHYFFFPICLQEMVMCLASMSGRTKQATKFIR